MMKRLLWLVLFFCGMAWAQGVRYDSVALNPRGAPIPNATITLCTGTATGTPCSPAALGYTDITTSVSCVSGFPVVQQIGGGCTSTTDGNGNLGFWLIPGTYKYSISGPSVATPQTYTITVPVGATAGGTPTMPSLTITGALTAGVSTLSEAKVPLVNKVISVDGVTYTGAQALQTAIQACSGSAACVVDGRDPLIGTQTFTVNPFSGLNMPITLYTSGYTVQWDHAAFFVDFPSNFRWELNGTTVLNSSGSTGAGLPQIVGFSSVNCFFCSRIYSTTGSITSGTKTLNVASSTNLTVGSYIIVIGALGAQSLQQTTTNGATGTGTSFVVNSLSGWDNTGTKNNYLQVESEQMVCSMSGLTALTFTGCTRGINGTTAVSHANAINVNATQNLITRIAAISGNTLTLADSATTTVTSAQVYAGVSNVIIEGMGVFDGQQTVATANRFLHGTLLTLSGNVTIGPGLTYKRWDQGGVSLFASGDNWVMARHYEGNGKPPLATGWDIALFESSSHNHIASASHSVGLDAAGATAGDIGLFIDDRSSNHTPLDGACVGNIAELGDIGYNSGYTQGVIIQSTSKFNHVTVPYVKTAGTGTAIEINYDSDWIVNGVATNVNPIGNVIQFGAVDSTGGTAITTTGFTGVGQNRIEGGEVVGGSVSVLSGSDYTSYIALNSGVPVHSVLGTENEWVMGRSAGAVAFPDIVGNPSAVVIGDSHGMKLGVGPFLTGGSTVIQAGDTVYGTYRVTTDQTITAGASLTNIPGLSWTMPASTALNVQFHCEGSYNESTAATSMQFGIQDVTVAPTNIYTKKIAWTSTTAATADNTPTLTTTTATGIGAAFTPSAATTVFNFTLDGMIEQPSNASTSVINIMAQFTTNNGTIKRGTFCNVY